MMSEKRLFDTNKSNLLLISYLQPKISKENMDCSCFVMCLLIALPLPRAFLRQPQTVLKRQTRKGVYAINKSIFLRCLFTTDFVITICNKNLKQNKLKR